MMAATGKNLSALMLGILTINELYALMVFKTEAFAFTSAFLLRTPFLFMVDLFFGYLVYLQKIGEERLPRNPISLWTCSSSAKHWFKPKISSRYIQRSRN